MGDTTSSQIAYPGGLSPNLALKLVAAADSAEAANGESGNGIESIAGVTSDVTTAVNQITSTSQGKFVDKLGSFWDGVGGKGGAGGVISDSNNALAILEALSGVSAGFRSGSGLGGVSTLINEQLPAIHTGLTTISILQSNPHATLSPEQVSAYQGEINALMNALSMLNSQFLDLASSINQKVSGLKLTVCASGVTPGDPGKSGEQIPLWEEEPQPPAGGSGGGGEPPIGNGGKGPSAEGDEPPGSSRFMRLLKGVPKYLKTNFRVAVGVGTFNTLPYAVTDIIHGKNPLADSRFWSLYAANLAQGYAAAPVLKGARSLLAILKVPETDGNTVLAQAFLGAGILGDGVVVTPWLLDQLKGMWGFVTGGSSPKTASTLAPPSSPTPILPGGTTETTRNLPDGSTETIVTQPNGTVLTIITTKNGTTETFTFPNGSTETIQITRTGGTITTKDPNGKITITPLLPGEQPPVLQPVPPSTTPTGTPSLPTGSHPTPTPRHTGTIPVPTGSHPVPKPVPPATTPIPTPTPPRTGTPPVTSSPMPTTPTSPPTSSHPAPTPVGTKPSHPPTGNHLAHLPTVTGIAHGEYEMRVLRGKHFSTVLVPPLQLPHWLKQHGVSSFTIPTTPTHPVTSAHPEIIGIVHGEFKLKFLHGKHYTTALVSPLQLPHWLAQHGASTVTVLKTLEI